MEPSILKDVCAEVTCLHTSGLRKVAVLALGQTVAVGGGVSVRPTKQGSVSGVLRKPVSFREDVFPSDVSVVSAQVDSFKGKLGQWSYSARPIFMDRFFPCTQELECLDSFERERILGTTAYESVVFLHPALKVSRNGGEAVCDVCRQPWRDRQFHVSCVRSEQVQRCQVDHNPRVLGSRHVDGERKS